MLMESRTTAAVPNGMPQNKGATAKLRGQLGPLCKRTHSAQHGLEEERNTIVPASFLDTASSSKHCHGCMHAQHLCDLIARLAM